MTLVLDIVCARDAFRLEVRAELRSGITALLGPNGSGKSTLLHAIAGLLRPDRGRIALGDRVLLDREAGVDVPAHRRKVGVVFQDLRLFPHLTVRRNLGYGRPARHANPALADAAVERLALAPLLDRRPDALSGGERQRAAVARALIAQPDLLLMDEPLSAVDVLLRADVLAFLRDAHARHGIRIVYVTHALADVLALTDDVLLLDQGRVAGHGEVFEVLGCTPHTAGALSIDSTLPVVIDEVDRAGDHVRARVGSQRVVLPFRAAALGEHARVAVGPQDVMLAKGPLQGISARNQLRGTVARVSPLRGRTLVHVEIADGAVLRAELTRDALRDLGIEGGTEVVCVVKTSSFRWC